MNFNTEREEFQTKINNLIYLAKNREIDDETLFLELTKLGDTFFTNIEGIIRNKICKEVFNKARKSDLLITIEEMFKTAICYCDLLTKIVNKINKQYSRCDRVFIFLQTVYKSNAEKKKTKEYKEMFKKHNLSIDGFECRRTIKMKSMKKNTKGMIITTIVSLLIIIALIIYNNLGKNVTINIPLLIVSIILFSITLILCLSKFVKDSSTYILFRILIALCPSLALVSLLNVTIKINLTIKTISVEAFGVVALTIFFYVVNPAKPQEYKTKSELEKK